MEKRGIIYKSEPTSMGALTKLKYRFLRTLGAAMASFSMAVLIYSYTPLLASDLIADSDYIRTEESVKLTTPKPKYIEQYRIIIPKIGADSDIILNVDPGNEEEYMDALSKGVAHAKGTSLPGQPGRTYLFAHSTNSLANVTTYNAVFYQLRNLNIGDQILLSDGYKYFYYKVTDKVIVSANDVSWLNKGNEEELVLQTCDPPGTAYKRLLVIAKPETGV